MNNAKQFGRKLRELRDQKGWTQGQLAEKIRVKREAIARWESGNREPGWSFVLALANALDVTCQDFTDEPPPSDSAGAAKPAKAKSQSTREAK
jgi:transcriptional regulator with XRE-family HTH domain